MKKSIINSFAILVIALFMSSLNVDAQESKFGIYAGVGAGLVDDGYIVSTDQAKLHFAIGAIYDIPITNGINIVTGGKLNFKGAETSRYNLTLPYLEIPGILNFYIGNSFYLATGLSLNICISPTLDVKQGYLLLKDIEVNRFEIPVHGGFGVMITEKFGAELMLNYSLTSIFPDFDGYNIQGLIGFKYYL